MIDKIVDKVQKYMLAQLDKLTAWIGLIGLILQALHMQSFLFILFVALIALPEGNFSAVFKKWTKSLKDLDKE